MSCWLKLFAALAIAASSVAVVAQVSDLARTGDARALTSPAVAEPRPALKVKPKFISGDRAEFPDEAKALGHHGTALVRLEIDATGTVVAVSLARSSNSELLDNSALAAARSAKLTPAISVDGVAIPLKFVTPYEFYQFKSSEPGGGFVRYRCDAFTREMDWWDGTHPNQDGKGEENLLYTMLRGMRVMANPRGIEAGLLDGSAKMAHEKDWANARKQCRANPERLVLDFLELRDFLISMSKFEAGRAKRKP